MDVQTKTLFDAEAFAAFERAAGHAKATVNAMGEGLSALAMADRPRLEAEKTEELCRLIQARVEAVVRRLGGGQ